MIGLVVWTVLCVGVVFAIASGGVENPKDHAPLFTGLAIGCILWAFGVALWYGVGLLFL